MKHKDDAIANGNVCPHCGELDTNESQGSGEFSDTMCYLKMACSECDKEWIEKFKLMEIQNA